MNSSAILTGSKSAKFRYIIFTFNNFNDLFVCSVVSLSNFFKMSECLEKIFKKVWGKW